MAVRGALALGLAALLGTACGEARPNGEQRGRQEDALRRLQRMVYQRAGTVERDPAELAFDEGGESDPRDARVERPFFIDRFEVTNAAFEEFVSATHYRGEGPGFLIHFEGPLAERRCPPGREEEPVVWVSYRDALAYAEWRGLRLPTLSEWQLTARGGTERPYPWGRSSDVATRANVLSTGLLHPSPVGFFESGRSDSGCYDLIGNVWEWTATPGPRPGSRVQVGGAFNTPAGSVAKASLHLFFLDADLWLQGEASRSSDRGFRCCVDAEVFLEGLLEVLAEAPDSEAGRRLREALLRLPGEARALAASIARRLSGTSAPWITEIESS